METEAMRWFGEYRANVQNGRLALPRCASCARWHWYPKSVCPHCFSPDWRWREASGRGTLFSWTTVRQSFIPDAPAPYTIVLVEMAEDHDIRLVGNLDPAVAVDGLRGAMSMSIVFGKPGATGSVGLPVFAPIDAKQQAS